jgi:hypothetical protein
MMVGRERTRKQSSFEGRERRSSDETEVRMGPSSIPNDEDRIGKT